MLDKIDHIGIAVRDLEESLKFYRDRLGLTVKGIETVPGQKVRVAFLPLGESNVELLEPTDAASPVARYIEKNGAGIQHLAFRVSNLEEKLACLKEQGVKLIDEKPRHGAGGARIAFIHPQSAGGVLVELCEH